MLAFSDDLKQLEKRQFSEFKTEIILRSKMRVLTEISDSVSLKVKEQYEKHPYPRWINTALSQSGISISELARRSSLKVINKTIYGCKAPEILIAGCGTGQHSILTANRFKGCSVLAIDLCLNSLAYANKYRIYAC